LGHNKPINDCRQHHTAECGSNRQRRCASAGQMTDRELALDFQCHHEEEDREERIVDPIQQRHQEGGSA
jgi:hypothetical protein